MGLGSDRPLVSVVVPNYNHSRFLSERFHSIFSQTFQDFELIVLDDASTDDSLEVIRRELAGRRYRLIVNPVNSGSPCSQWLRGIAEARGTYIWLAESDDSCRDDFLASLVACLEEGACLAYCRTSQVDEVGAPVSCLEYWPDRFDGARWRESFQIDAAQFNRRYMRQANCIPNASAVVFRRDHAESLAAFSGMLQRKMFTGDWIFWYLFLEQCRGALAFVHRELCQFRWHSMATRVAGSRQGEIRRLREYCDGVDYILSRSPERRPLRWLLISIFGGWDWMLVEYLVRYKPSMVERFLARGLHGRLALGSYVRLVCSSQMRRYYFHPNPVVLIYP